jgi:hypothetical protein
MRKYLLLLRFIAVLHIILGLSLPFISQFESVSTLLLATMLPGLSLTEEVAKQVTYIIAVFGPTVASWGILFLVLVNSYFKRPDQTKWWGLIGALIVWFITDTVFSLLHGVSIALMLNGVVALFIIVPLWKSRCLIQKE